MPDWLNRLLPDAELPEWLARYLPEGWTSQDCGIAILVFAVVSAVVSIGLVAVVVVRIPANYFVGDRPPRMFIHTHPFLRWPLLIAKNLFGIILVGTGIIMSLPGVPGQGILTVLIGCMLLDFPGKRKVEKFILRRRGVNFAIQKLRAKFGKPPLELEEQAVPVSPETGNEGSGP